MLQSISANSPNWPRLPSLMDGIIARLKMTGHRDEESRALGGRWNRRVFVARGERAHGIPQIAVCYTIHGDTITFDKILIS
jgi:hypothetical protein